MKISRVQSLLLICMITFCTPDSLLSNDDEKINAILERTQKTLERLENSPNSNPDVILARINKRKTATEAEKRKKKIDALMWQNTLITPKTLGSGVLQVGLYNSDLIEGSFLLADTIADVELYKSLTRRRVDHIVQSLIDDSDELIKVLKKTNASEARFDERMRLTHNAVSRLFVNDERAKDILLNPLRRYLAENHALITGYNPFTKKTLVPLLLRWGWDKMGAYLESKVLVPSPLQDVAVAKETFSDYKYPELLHAQFYANEVTPEGNVVRAKHTVFSATTLARCFLQPTTVLRKKLSWFSDQQVIANNLGIMSYAGKFAGVTLPKFLTSSYMSLGLDILSIGLAGHYYEELNTQRWTAFVLQNRERLLNKIYAYRKAVTDQSSDEVVVKVARQELREFVEKGHISKSWISGAPLFEWLSSREKGKQLVLNRLSLATGALMVIAAGKFFYNLKNSA